jgi:hypothetical protein
MKSKFRSDLEQTLNQFSKCPTLRAQGETLRVAIPLETSPQLNTKDHNVFQTTGQKELVIEQDTKLVETLFV